MNLKPVKSEYGWEIEVDGCLEDESISKVYRTEKMCRWGIKKMGKEIHKLESAEKRYYSQMAYACGYHD